MDKGKIFFVAGLSALALGGALVLGMQAAVRKTRLYDVVWGTLDNAKTLIEEIPNLRGTEPIHFLRPARYEGEGVTLNDKGPGGAKQDDLLLLSGFLKDDNKVQLIRRDGSVVNEWVIRAHDIFPDASFFRDPPMTNWNAITHGTIITPEGDIVFSFESGGLVRMDRCGKVKWADREVTHHSPNWGANGTILVSGGRYVDGKGAEVPWPWRAPYWEDEVRRYDGDGKRLMSVPLTTLFKTAGLAPLLTATGEFKTRTAGEFHLNEVEELSPELAPDFPMFQAGDLLLSLRHRNMILVTDAEAKVIKWWKIGPFVRQHDPDFEKGGKITVFDNHSDETLDGHLEGGSRIWQIDVASGAASVLYGGSDAQRFYSPERGTHQRQPDGNILITEAQQGRAFEVTPEGRTVWSYVNRWDRNRVTWLHDAEAFDPGYFTVTDWSCPAP